VVQREPSAFAVRLRAVGLAQAPSALQWGLFREAAENWSRPQPLPPGSAADEASGAVRTPLAAAGGGWEAELRIPSALAPTSLALLLLSPGGLLGRSGGAARGPAPSQLPPPGAPPAPLVLPLGFGGGWAAPLGASASAQPSGTSRLNFALHSAAARSVVLYVQWGGGGEGEGELEIALDSGGTGRTGDVWHCSLEAGPGGALPAPGGARRLLWGWRCGGAVGGEGALRGERFNPGRVLFDPRARALGPPLFAPPAPPGVAPPQLLGELLAPEAAAARGGGLGRPAAPLLARLPRGPFADLALHAARLAALGVTHVELPPFLAELPADAAAACAPGAPPAPPASLHAADGARGGERALAAACGALRAAGLRVLAPLPLAHTAERVGAEPPCSLAGIDAPSYFRIGAGGELAASAAAPPPGPAPNRPPPAALEAAAAATQELVLAAARDWVARLGADGLVFYGAAAAAGGPLGRAPLLESLALDAVVGGPHATLFYAGEGGAALPHWGVAGAVAPGSAEDAGAFASGAPGALSRIATRLCGGGAAAGPLRAPRQVLQELPAAVTDGAPDAARLLLLLHLCSVGVPTLDGPHLYPAPLAAFVAAAAAARARHADLLAPAAFPTDQLRAWAGADGGRPAWEDAAAPAFISFAAPAAQPRLLAAFNASGGAVRLAPPAPPPGRHWRLLLDCAAPPPADCAPRELREGEAIELASPGGVLLECVEGVAEAALEVAPPPPPPPAKPKARRKAEPADAAPPTPERVASATARAVAAAEAARAAAAEAVAAAAHARRLSSLAAKAAEGGPAAGL